MQLIGLNSVVMEFLCKNTEAVELSRARFILENSAAGGYEIIIKACHWSKGLAHSMEMDYLQKL